MNRSRDIIRALRSHKDVHERGECFGAFFTLNDGDLMETELAPPKATKFSVNEEPLSTRTPAYFFDTGVQHRVPEKKIEGASGLGKRVWRKTKAFIALAPAKLPAKKKRDHADAHFITETTRGQTSVAFGPRGVVSARARGFGWPSP